MRQKDFRNIINLKAEYKEYCRFEKGRSKLFSAYVEWDAHIKDLLLSIKDHNDMYNLKRYCADIIRSNNDSTQIILAYISLALPIALAFATEQDIIGIRGWFNGGMMFACLIIFLITSKITMRKKHFCEDILRVIEQIESQP